MITGSARMITGSARMITGSAKEKIRTTPNRNVCAAPALSLSAGVNLVTSVP